MIYFWLVIVAAIYATFMAFYTPLKSRKRKPDEKFFSDELKKQKQRKEEENSLGI